MTLEKAMTIGKRWQKGTMDRVYFNLTEDIMDKEASNGVEIRKFFNRYERGSLKAYYDVTADQMVITSGDSAAKAELAAIIESL